MIGLMDTRTGKPIQLNFMKPTTPASRLFFPKGSVSAEFSADTCHMTCIDYNEVNEVNELHKGLIELQSSFHTGLNQKRTQTKANKYRKNPN